MIKKYLRPFLKSIGLYDLAYRTFFTFYKWHNKIIDVLNKRFKRTALIFTYHRIADAEKDPHLLCVPPKIFAEQINFFKNNFEMISLSELTNRLRNNSLSGNEATITFDDGYLDNLTNALPILEKYQVPATIFIATGQLGQTANFSWDIEYKDSDRAKFLNEEEILTLAKHPLIEIGAHTHNHLSLATLPYKEQLKEIETSKNILERICNKSIKHFAYPFGGLFDFNKYTLQALKKLEFKTACTTTEKRLTSYTPLLKLTRFNMRKYSANQLKSWYK